MGLKAGAWKSNTTPPIGCCIAGSFNVIRATGVIDDLYVHALALDDGATKAVIVSCDIIGIPSDLTFGRIIPEIAKQTGISKDNIMVCSTHIHSGPVMGSPLPEVFGWPDEAYNDYFCKAIVTAVLMADQRKVEVTVNAGKAVNDRCVFNRRLQKPDGSIIMNWVKSEYVKDLPYSSGTDTELIAIRLDDLQGKPVALLANYGNHNNAASGPLINPDMAGHMRKVLSGVYGQEMVTLFLMAPSGNVNWIDHLNPEWHSQLADTWTRFGASMAGTVLQALTAPERVPVESIAIAHEVLHVSERPYCDYDTFEDGTFGPPEKAQDFFDGYRLDKQKYGGLPSPAHAIDVHAIRIGNDFAITTNPFEYFIEYGKRIKEQSPFKYTMVSQLTNGEEGYVPTKEAFTQGGYEVRKVMMGSFLEVDAGDRVADCSVRLLKRLKESDQV